MLRSGCSFLIVQLLDHFIDEIQRNIKGQTNVLIGLVQFLFKLILKLDELLIKLLFEISLKFLELGIKLSSGLLQLLPEIDFCPAQLLSDLCVLRCQGFHVF